MDNRPMQLTPSCSMCVRGLRCVHAACTTDIAALQVAAGASIVISKP